MATVSSRSEFLSEILNLNQRFEELSPEIELTVRDPQCDVEGYVVVWNTWASKGGPLGRCGKGGTRITPQVSLAEVGRLAKTMTLKNAAAGLALGGAKSGLRADPDAPEFEHQYRRFVQLIKPLLLENGGLFGGLGFDIGGRPQHPIWACEELGSRRGFTGKPLHLGGTDYDREGIAGLGVAVAAQTLCERKKLKFDQVTFAVQGLGAMGGAVIRYFSETGARLGWIADPRLGGTFELPNPLPAGLLEALSQQKFDDTVQILAKLGAKAQNVDEVLYAPATIVFPCAVQDVIHQGNVEKIACKIVAEGANGPTTESSRTRLFEKGIDIIPDFIANPGGIIAAYVEMNSDLEASKTGTMIPGAENARRAKEFTRERIRKNVDALYGLVEKFEVDSVQAGRYLALRSIFGEAPVDADVRKLSAVGATKRSCSTGCAASSDITAEA